MSTFQPQTGTLDAWNAAYVRVDDYLRAHRIHNRLHQSRLILLILERAALRHAQDTTRHPVTLAAEEAAKLMDSWFRTALGAEDEELDRVAIDGRVAMLLADGAEKWPYAFLDEKHLPEELVAAMRTGHMRGGPDLKVSSMVPREIDLGRLSEVAGDTIERIEKWPILRTLLLWLLFLAALGAIFQLSR